MSLTPAITETLFALGVGDRIVGKSQDVLLYPPEAGPIPDVEKFDGSAVVVDVEKIVADKADLVIAGGNFGTPPDAIQKLRALGIPVLVLYAPDVKTVFGDIGLQGQAVGKAAEAAAIVATMQAAFTSVKDAVAGAPRPRVYYEIDATGAFYGPADKSFLAEMISLAGGDPITTGSPDKYDIPAERLLTADPQVILLGDAAYGVTAADVAKRPGWSTMTAVKDGAIRPIDDTTITRPGPRLFSGLQLLGLGHPPRPGNPVGKPDPARPVISTATTVGDTGARLQAASRARDRRVQLVVVGLVVLAIGALLGIGLGTVAIPIGDTLAIVADRLLGTHLSSADPAMVAIVWDLRVPRVLTAMVVGAGLAVAGATFQGLLRNPLADPYVLGTASGAALGAAIAVLIPVRALFLGFGLVQAFAFVGRPPGDHRGLQAVAGERPRAAHQPAADRLRRRLAARRGPRDGDVPVRRRAPPDLQLPARELRDGVLGAARRGAADRRRRLAADHVPGEVAQRAAAGRGGRQQPRDQRGPGAGDAARPRLARHRGRRDHQRAHRLRRAGRAPRRPPPHRSERASRHPDLADLGREPHGLRRPRRPAGR